MLIFVLLYGGSQVVARWYLLKIGYTIGAPFIDSIFSSGLMTSLTKSASHLGLKHGRRDGRFDGERQAGLDDSGRSDLGCRPRRRQLDYAGDLVGRTGLRPGRIN